MIHEFMNGREVNWNDKDLQLKWVREELPQIPVWVAGYGPKALGVAGRVGDGVIIQLADPEIVSWIMDTARRAAEEAGRDPSQLKCIVGAPSHVGGDLADARDQVRWFPAMVSNHVMDLIERYGADGSAVPKALTDYVHARKFYDYDEHSRVGAKHGEFVTDEICDRFCVLGSTDQIKATLKELEELGVEVVNCFSGCPGDGPGASRPNWVTCAWPPEYAETLDWQWSERAIPYWTEEARFARENGLAKIALEAHPGFLVYNPETALR